MKRQVVLERLRCAEILLREVLLPLGEDYASICAEMKNEVEGGGLHATTLGELEARALDIAESSAQS